VYYSGLLAWVGCHTDAYEQAKWFGDDALLKSDAHYGIRHGQGGAVRRLHAAARWRFGAPLATRARVGVGFLGEGRKALVALADNHYQATGELAARLGLGDEIRDSLRQSYERWDGKGAYGMKREEIALDDVISVDHAAAIQRTIPEAQLAVVPGTNHLLQFEKPDLVNRVILDFLAGKQAPKLFSDH
jgi:pimeloyl-ACP methyl ester carboxylesterase